MSQTDNNAVRKPNLFIVGAGKSGTTALYEYLNQHPAIFMSPVKEPHYFASDFYVKQSNSTFSRFTDEDAYLNLFENAANEVWLGEASPSYLPSTVAASKIYEFNPDSRIIIMLRNPIEAIYAAYHQLRFGLVEPLPTFEEALAAQDARSKGQQLPKNMRVHPSLLQYQKVMEYPAQIRRYWDIFPREQVHIIIYDDFKTNTDGVVRDVLRYLNIDDTVELELEQHNRSKTYRSAFVQSLLYQLPEPIVNVAIKVRPLVSPLHRWLLQWNQREEKRPPIQAETLAMLQAHYRPQVEELSTMLNRDLTHWCGS